MMQGLGRKNSKIVRVRLQDSEVEQLQAEARERGVTVSALIRSRIFQAQIQRVIT